MQDGPSAKQQVVERIKESTNILVTVGKNPSVDALSAALGFTLLLNKMEKHATAVFSGKIPRAIDFLDPGKTFENTTDSLRDFIIALDKEKADHLRYKVEGDVVRIFITPYRTTITDKDLEFSQGDFNVEAVIAIGVEKREDLDQAITAHGRILHDAPVITVNNSIAASSLGTIDWQEQQASSLSEMMASLADTIAPDILDEQIATALLTGIVASTERFSNKNTTPKVMTISAQLMAAGANQQLIATKLESSQVIGADKKSDAKSKNKNGTELKDGEQSSKLSNEDEEEPKEQPRKDGSLQISHEESHDEPKDNRSVTEQIEDSKEKAAIDAAEDALASVLPQVDSGANQADDLAQDLNEAAQQEQNDSADLLMPAIVSNSTPEATVEKPSWMNSDKIDQAPTLGGILNATSEQAAIDAEKLSHDERNRTILSHGEGEASNETPQEEKTENSAEQKPEEKMTFAPHEPAVQHEKIIQPPSHQAPMPAFEPELPKFEPLPPAPVPENQFADVNASPASLAPAHDAHADDALKAVHDALSAADPTSSAAANLSSQPLGGIIQHNNDHFAAASPPMQPQQQDQPEPVAQAFPSAPQPPVFDMQSLPPMPPDFSTLPPVQPMQPDAPDPFGLPPVVMPISQPVPQPAPNDPGQFKIPGQ